MKLEYDNPALIDGGKLTIKPNDEESIQVIYSKNSNVFAAILELEEEFLTSKDCCLVLEHFGDRGAIFDVYESTGQLDS